MELLRTQIQILWPRALYMGELRKNTTSTGTITKKKTGYFGKSETVGTKKFFLLSNFFSFLD